MFEIDKKKFGAFITQLRKEKGITQKELAERLFISDKAVSKWETASSVPDIALLMPLADIFGVTVTELLMCQRMEADNSLNGMEVEKVVKTAISYSEEEQTQTYQNKNKWCFSFVVATVIASIEVLFAYITGHVSPCMIVAVIMGAILGLYFCFFAKTTLPTYYDDNRICVYTDGLFELNLPGLAFNNSNWDKILNVGRIWALTLLVTYPLISYITTLLFSGIWQIVTEIFITLLCMLGGLFVPAYIVGRKYE